jgi:hypothetical protein
MISACDHTSRLFRHLRTRGTSERVPVLGALKGKDEFTMTGRGQPK